MTWPVIPPWWLVSSPTLAGILGRRSSDLRRWAARGTGPSPFPSLYIKPTRGVPLWYRWGDVQSWLARQIGETYPFPQQCQEFFAAWVTVLAEGTGDLSSRCQIFDELMDQGCKAMGKGDHPLGLRRELVLALDQYWTTQPRHYAEKFDPRVCAINDTLT